KPDEIKELADDIISSARRLLRITENFLIYVRIESYASSAEKRKQLRQLRTDEPGAMIYDVATMLADSFGRSEDLEILDLVDSISAELSTESFHKVIDELLDNAFKFSTAGTKITVKSWIEDNFMFLEIKDLGRGMTKDQINNVGAYVQFERTIYEQQGVGLGLVIAKRFVELHDGQFVINSSEGKGCSIVLSVPFVYLTD
ncbi:MAG: ATP-binding protein, partial [Candidatus Kapabacteria bacterium]|nr:ATP-binding protein [Candidatus Kapabacteria bacterium]